MPANIMGDQRWHDDPPIGAIVFGHERVIDSATADGSR
jgi:hypothetical protein